VQEIYGDGQTTRFTYLDYEQPFFNKKLDVRLGKINQQNDFIAGPSYWGGNLYCYFQNNNICGTPAAIPTDNGVVPGGTEGYDYYPSSDWGVRLKVSPTKNWYVEGAALQANPIVNSNHGGAYFGFSGATGTELPFEIGLTLRNGSGDGVGDIRFGGYYDTSNVFSFSHETATYAPATDSNAAVVDALPPDYVRGRSGAYVQLDHLVEGSSLVGKRGTTVFVNAEYGDPNTALISSFVDAGIVRHGTFINRPKDTLALGFSTENYNPRLQQLELDLQSAGYLVPYNGSEQAFEFNYGWQASSWLLVRPGFQYVLNPAGEQTHTPPGLIVPRSALVFGLTTVISF
jgi:porin